jgi:hypothetical protein
MTFEIRAAPLNGHQNRIYLALENMQQNMLSTGDLIKIKKQDQVRNKI